MRANNQKPYLPKEGKLVSDINRAWDRLEKAEHERQLALIEELTRYCWIQNFHNPQFQCTSRWNMICSYTFPSHFQTGET